MLGGFYMIRVRAQRTYIPWEDAGRLENESRELQLDWFQSHSSTKSG